MKKEHAKFLGHNDISWGAKGYYLYLLSQDTPECVDTPEAQELISKGLIAHSKGKTILKKLAVTPDWKPFLEGAITLWTKYKGSSWLELEKLTGRDIKYLREFFAFFDEDLERSLEMFSVGVRWAKHKEAWIQQTNVLSLAELMVNQKLITYAQKGKANLKDKQERSRVAPSTNQVYLYANSFKVRVLGEEDGRVKCTPYTEEDREMAAISGKTGEFYSYHHELSVSMK